MPLSRSFVLPANLCHTQSFNGKSIYSSDYSARSGIKIRSGTKKRTATAPATTLNNMVEKLLMTDHYNPTPVGLSNKKFEAALKALKLQMENTNLSQENDSEYESYRYELKSATPLLSDIAAREKQQDADTPLEDLLPESLLDLKKAIHDEASATKRERGIVYGLAGKKMSLSARKESSISKGLPGLDLWLQTANELEKSVVHEFISTVSQSLQDVEASSGVPVVPKDQRSVRIVTPSQTKLLPSRRARSAEYYRRFDPTPDDERPKSAFHSRPASSNSSQSIVNLNLKNISTQVCSPMLNEPQRRVRCSSAPAVSATSYAHREVRHLCEQCPVCKEKLVRKMVEELGEETPKSLKEIIAERKRGPPMMSKCMYPVEDYIHTAASFQKVNSKTKGYFIIHPEFVSENGGLRYNRKDGRNQIF